jgi:trans-aconitate methyltransferase
VLELGCGGGRDTASLLAHGLSVIALDRSPEALAQARRAAPQAQFHCQDLQAPFPATPGASGVVLASLSLHYFSWPDTVALLQRIHAQLGSGGLLLCRLNSTQDVHYGATGHAEIAPHYYRVDGAAKRFFDAADVQALFGAGWTTLHAEEGVIQRYAQPKWAWELVLRRAAAP